MTIVWLARHGEVHNPGKVLYGRLPRMRLTPEGHRQADALADFLAPRRLAAVYSSPLLRARLTARAIAAGQYEASRVRIDADLQEIRSAWQGEPLTELEAIAWDLYANPRAADDESLGAIRDRMLRWLDRVLRRHAGGEVVGVSHGDPILILAGTMRGLPLHQDHIFPRPYIDTGALFRMQFDAARRCRDVQLLVPHARVAA
jgi:broad specificity phosphatase PhoE